MRESRVKKSITNVKVNTICYVFAFLVAFFTRKVFIDYLGTEFIGLASTLQSLLGFLNLAELGVSSAIAYFLYRPLFDSDQTKIRELVSLMGYIYRIIGRVILGAGILLSLFLPLIYPDVQFPLHVVYTGYFAFLFSALLGYFCNYKMVLLSADQKNYIITGYYQVTSILKAILQMVLAIYFTNFILYFAIELLFGIINSVILNYNIRRNYPWLQTDLTQGRQLFKLYPEVWRKVRDLFFHKIGGFVQFQIMPFLVYGFVSLPMVALYTNYTIITDKIKGVIASVLGSTSAGVGSLIAEGDETKIDKIFSELFFLSIFFAFVVSSAIYFVISDFISLWIGAEYILSDVVTFLICLNLFLSISRQAVDQFIFGYGLFQDIFAPLAESVIFVICSLIFGSLYGLPGVLAGPIISLLLVVHIWKPYFLYTRGFNRSIFQYFILFVSHIVPLTISYFITAFIVQRLSLPISLGWLAWFVDGAMFVLVEAVVATILLLPFSKGLRGFVSRFIKF